MVSANSVDLMTRKSDPTGYTPNTYHSSDIIVQEFLAVGGYSTVFKGKMKKSRRIVAMKTLLPTRYESKEKQDQEFDNEIGTTSANILIKDGVAKITDFGLSGNPNQESSMSRCRGHPAYIDPMCFTTKSYKRGKKSDIFSLGNVLWEIASGQVPCNGYQTHEIVIRRLSGKCDEDEVNEICGLPKDYITLYSDCWKECPDDRPSCEQVYDRLKLLRPTSPSKGLDLCRTAYCHYSNWSKNNRQILNV
ncbi:7226_t:CDS:2 [Paraglomus occultum]|uniref:7226_t:CDS:1 n=1 Tax=Paraglomus occultum TaxID=144539 RepID=A0A9N9F4X4_9GLOM|nr:7226_t:CDS:2 [Paraglomus occultum]